MKYFLYLLVLCDIILDCWSFYKCLEGSSFSKSAAKIGEESGVQVQKCCFSIGNESNEEVGYAYRPIVLVAMVLGFLVLGLDS